METHAHLGGEHADRVRTYRDERRDSVHFAIDCPFCDEGLDRVVKPRGREPEFVEEFRREITLVGFDLLLYHLHAAHAERVGLPPVPPDAEAVGEAR